MHISLEWLNALLSPGDLTAEEAERVLTFVGFPIESAAPVAPVGGGAGGPPDTVLDVEVTSNRGDCLSHVGIAREVAAATGRQVRLPHAPEHIDPAATKPGSVGNYVTLENRVAGPMGVGGCPLFTLRLISGVKIGPSPAWMVRRLHAVGQRSINNVVDCTNYVLFELGSPSHVFDLARLRPAGGWGGNSGVGGPAAVIVRGAEKGERLTLLDGKTVELRAGELVVADGERASSLAGIMGGAESAVTERTTDVVLEVATWSPGPVRSCARRLNVRTDASHRFERRVDPRTVEAASRRVAELIVQTAGGALVTGVLHAGEPVHVPAPIVFRPARCRRVLGAAFGDERMRAALLAQGLEVSSSAEGAERWFCRAPTHRPDLSIEEDLIEEVARTIGLEEIPVHDRVSVRVAPPQRSELALREVSRVLTGLGFHETVTFSFVRPRDLKPFVPAGVSTLAVSDDRRGDEGTLRASLLTSLLACRRANQHARSASAGVVRLYETASVYAERSPGRHEERRVLGLLMDAPAEGGTALERKQAGVRLMRGVVDHVAAALVGRGDPVRVAPTDAVVAGLDAAGSAAVWTGERPLGVFGLASEAVLRLFDLEHPVVLAELDLATLVAGYPPRAEVTGLPAYPATDRDLSLVVDEGMTWAKVEAALADASPRWMERVGFVYTYRGKPLAEGKKSITLRMTFRAPDRTLRDEEVNAEVDRLIARAGKEIGATVRT